MKEKNKADQILKLAVKRMMPGGPLAKKQLSKLKIYNGETHPHEVQKPKIIDFDKLNKKNIVKL
jgi:large subunit ribosomal protein L13